MKKLLILGIFLVAAIGVAGIALGNIIQSYTVDENNIRPQHCIGEICAKSEVFENLPKYPENFNEVILLPLFGMYEDFSSKHPDENYYKQPEFYPDEQFEQQCLQYYTIKSMTFSSGSGPYPGDAVISNITSGDIFPVITYWHTGCAVTKYQLLGMVAEFPESVKIRMGDLQITQNPEKARQCFDVNIFPSTLLLEPTYPKFGYDWTQKVKVEITAKCKGDWVIQISPFGEPDANIKAQFIRNNGITKLSQMPQGGIWQIFVHVQ